MPGEEHESSADQALEKVKAVARWGTAMEHGFVAKVFLVDEDIRGHSGLRTNVVPYLAPHQSAGEKLTLSPLVCVCVRACVRACACACMCACVCVWNV